MKLTLDKSTLYTIETNNGVIGFDLLDSNNMGRIEQMYDEIKKAESKYDSDMVLIGKKNDISLNSYGVETKKREELRAFNNFENSCARALNKFFGKGASDKIFFEPVINQVVINQLRLEQLLVELLPKEFEKAGLKVDSIVKERESKRERFAVKDNKVKDLG